MEEDCSFYQCYQGDEVKDG